MAKDKFWFDHDYNARGDEKILEIRALYGAEGYGIFWMIIETMAENSKGGINENLIGGLSHGFGVAKDTLKGVIDLSLKIDLFYTENGFIYSRRIRKHKETRANFKEKGREGAEKRWGNRGAIGEGNAKDITLQDITPQEDSRIISLNKDEKIKKNSSKWDDTMRRIKEANPDVEHLK